MIIICDYGCRKSSLLVIAFSKFHHSFTIYLTQSAMPSSSFIIIIISSSGNGIILFVFVSYVLKLLWLLLFRNTASSDFRM
mmetsp:Transcript_30166/g.48422  ORF Transcript_30166/g.48422 Transcript_30166/m.48422 type:complete len:81 (-) Transcript_30166:737-979(-)